MAMNPARRIDLGFGLALLLVAGTGAIAYTATVRLAEVSAQVDEAHAVLTHTERVITGLLDAESAQRGFVITGNPGYLEPYEAAARQVTASLAELRTLLGDDAELQSQASRLGPLAQRRLRATGTIIATQQEQGFEAAAAIVRSGRGKELMDSVRVEAGQLQRIEQERLDAAAVRVERVARFAQVTVATGSLLAFMVLMVGVSRVRHEFRVRRRAETALRESETLLKQFMDTLPIGALVVDAEGRPSFANTTALTMLGQEALAPGGEALQLWRSGSPDPVPAMEMPLVRALQGLAATTDDLELRLGGRALPLEISAAPIYDSEGRVTYGIAAFSDITERKRNQAALRAAKEAAEHANEAKSEFLARMSHELRTPLNSIIGFANILLKRKVDLPERERTYLERILENGKNLLLLINDILDLSKIEAGKVVVEKELVDLGELIEQVLQQWDGQLRGGAVHLEHVVPAGTLPVFTDPARLRQVLVNLVSNAIKFTEAGNVRVIVENAPGTTRPRAIRVVDTGIGIPADRLDAIFDAFEQAETTTTRKYGGTGLGLPISRALCDLLGYGLTVTSTPGAGSTFAIHLDRARLPAAESGRAPAAAAQPAPLVVVVDDDAEARGRLSDALESLECRVVTAFSAEQGVHLARALQPQLVSVDLALPEGGAWGALARLRDGQQGGQAEVVLHTVEHDAGGAAIRVLDAIDVLPTPVTAELVEKRVRRPGTRSPRVLLLTRDDQVRDCFRRVLHAEVQQLRIAGEAAEATSALDAGLRPDVAVLDLSLPALDGFELLARLRGQERDHGVRIVVLLDPAPSRETRARLAEGTTTLLRRPLAADPDLAGALARCLPRPTA